MPKRYFLPFGSFAPDAQEFDSPALDTADNVVPAFGGLRPVQQKSTLATQATTGAVVGAHAHLLLSAEQIQLGRPIDDVSVDVWRSMPGKGTTDLYTVLDEVTASDADFAVTAGSPNSSAAEFQLTSLNAPGSNAHTFRWRYKVSGYSATPASVTSITRAGATATITFAAAHGMSSGDTLVVAGADQSEYNGTFAFTSTGSATGTYTVSGTPATPATGTITGKQGWHIKAELVETSTVRATQTVRGAADADWTATSYTLTGGEYAAITGYTDLRIRFTAEVPGSAQDLRPVSDVDNSGTWTTGAGSSSNLYAELDETAADDATSYIQTPALVATAASRDFTAALTTSGVDPLRTTGNVVSYRYKATNTGVRLVVSLMQGSTLIASQTHSNAATSWTTGTFTLSTAEYNAITDWTALRLRLQGSYPSGGVATATYQTSAPIATDAVFNLTTSSGVSYHGDIDDDPDALDGDFISSTSGGLGSGNATFSMGSLSDPLVHEDHQLRYLTNITPGSSVGLTLKQGGNTIASGTATSAHNGVVQTVTLSAAECALITDYGDLKLDVVMDGDCSLEAVQFRVPDLRRAQVSWGELETLSLARGAVSWTELQIPDPNNTYNADSQEIYAGTETAIYEVSEAGFSDVSIAGGYATSGSTPHSWGFTSWGGDVIATNYIDEVQTRAAGAALFANLMTSTERPNARFVTVIGPHVVLGDIINSGGTVTGHGDMVWWSAIDDAADFDPDIATQCDYQRLRGTSGQIMGLIGGIDYGLVFKRNSIYRMTYQGPPLIFSFESVSTQVGTPSPRSLVQVDDDVYFWTGNSFAVLRSGRQLETGIGGGAILKMLKDHTFESRAIEQVQANDQRIMDSLIFGAYDKSSGLILWSYRKKDGTVYRNDVALAYHPASGHWGYITDSSLDCAALLSLNNVMTDDTHLLKGIVGFSYDGSNSSYFKFKANETYAVSLTSKIISAQAITSAERRGGADNGVLIVGVRPVFHGEPSASTDPAITVTVTPSAEPLMQDGQDAVTANATEAGTNGVYPLSPPVVGEFFRPSLSLPSLSSQSIKDMPGMDIFWEEAP